MPVQEGLAQKLRANPSAEVAMDAIGEIRRRHIAALNRRLRLCRQCFIG